MRTRWVVAADGLHSPARRAAGLDRPVRGPVRYGLRRHYRLAPWTDLVEVHWSRHGEAYVTPLGPELVGVAVLAGPGSTFPERLAAFPALSALLRGAPPVTSVRGAGPLRQRAARRCSGRLLLVGDAAGYVDALTGEGIAVGLATARALASVLSEERPQDYDAAWRRESRRFRALTAALLWGSSRPAVRRSLVPAAQLLPSVFARAVDQLA